MANPDEYPLDPQEESEWCWAAVAQSVAKYFDESAQSQCAIAGLVMKDGNCCDNPVGCNEPAALTKALTKVGKPPELVNRPLIPRELQKELDEHRPVCIRIGWDGGGGHFVVITGYQVLTSGALHVNVADPLYPNCTIDYDELSTSYHGDGQWTHSYLVTS